LDICFAALFYRILASNAFFSLKKMTRYLQATPTYFLEPKKWLFLMVRHLGNHEFPDHEKNGLDLDFLLLIRCAFLHEFPFFKIKQQVGNCFTRYLQRREKQFPDE